MTTSLLPSLLTSPIAGEPQANLAAAAVASHRNVGVVAAEAAVASRLTVPAEASNATSTKPDGRNRMREDSSMKGTCYGE